MTSSPNKLTWHENGEFSFRIAGRWTKNVTRIHRSKLLALPEQARAQIYVEEYRQRRDIVTPPIRIAGLNLGTSWLRP